MALRSQSIEMALGEVPLGPRGRSRPLIEIRESSRHTGGRRWEIPPHRLRGSLVNWSGAAPCTSVRKSPRSENPLSMSASAFLGSSRFSSVVRLLSFYPPARGVCSCSQDLYATFTETLPRSSAPRGVGQRSQKKVRGWGAWSPGRRGTDGLRWTGPYRRE